MIKLICTDIDGTLLNKHRQVDAYTKKVFGKLPKDVCVVLASSRMPKALWHIQEDLQIEDMPIICYNGALTLSEGKDFQYDKVLQSISIDNQTIKKVLNLAGLHELHASIYFYNTWIVSQMDEWAAREINNTQVEPDVVLKSLSEPDIEKISLNDVHKIMIMGLPDKIDIVEKELMSLPIVQLCRSKATYLEITPIDTNKSKALDVLLKGIFKSREIYKDNIMSFGDNHNDLELLRDAKFGIAVGNGVEKLKQLAYAVTKTNHEHGVAEFINGFFKM